MAGDHAGPVTDRRTAGTVEGEPQRLMSAWLGRRIAGRQRLAEAVLLAASAVVAWALRFVQDDAFITYRYARNLARGEGLVFNPGDRVEGYTNFAWTVIHALPERLGWSTPVFSQVLGIVMMVACVFVVLRITHRLFAASVPDRGGFAMLVGLVLVANMTFLVYSTGGLETMMQTLVLMVVTWALLDALIDRAPLRITQLVLAGVFAGIAVLTRLDSVVYLAGLYAAVLHRQWGGRNRSLGLLARTIGVSALPAAVLVVPWLVWKLDYYGALLPNTFFAKSASDPLQPVLYGLFYVVGYLLSYGTFLLVGRFLRYRRGFFAVPGVAALFAVAPLWLAYVVYVGADFMEYRFWVVLTPLLAMLAAWLLDRFVNLRSQTLLVVVLMTFSLAHRFVVPPLAFPVLSFRTINHWPTDSHTTWYGLATLLADNFPGGQDVAGQPVIAVAPLGVISYFSDLETIDMLGLTDSEVARHGEDAQMYYPGHVKMATPGYLESRGVDLIIGQPGPLRDPQRYDGYRLSQLVEVYPVVDLRELPDDAVVVELPATTTPDGTDIVWPTIYLGGNELVDDAIERNGWVVKPIIRECDPDDLDVWLTRLVASRTCPDL